MKLKQKRMTTNQTPEKDKNVNPEQEAPKLPESVLPEIQTERDNIKGQVLYSSNPEEIGNEQTPAEAYKTATNNHLAAIANKDPHWLQQALITRKIAKEREQIVVDDLANRQGEQNRHADLLTGKQQKDWLKLQTDLETKRAALAAKEAKTRETEISSGLKSIFSGIGSSLAALPAGAYYGWKDIRDDYKRKKHLN